MITPNTHRAAPPSTRRPAFRPFAVDRVAFPGAAMAVATAAAVAVASPPSPASLESMTALPAMPVLADAPRPPALATPLAGAGAYTPYASCPFHPYLADQPAILGSDFRVAGVLHVVDLDGDGRGEVVAPSVAPNPLPGMSDRVAVIGWSGGRLGEPTIIESGAPLHERMIVVDFERDGDPDVVVWGHDGTEMTGLRNDGGRLVPVWSRPLAPFTAQIDARLRPDGEVSILYPSPDESGVIEAVFNDQGLPSGGTPVVEEDARFVVLLDADGDGRTDLLTRTWTGEVDETRFRFGAPDGTFPGTGTLIETGMQTNGVFGVADVDGDGRDDLLVPRQSDAVRIQVLFGSDGGLEPPLPLTGGPGQGASFRVSAGDLDGDGDLDLAVATRGPDIATLGIGVDLYRNDGDRVFTYMSTVPIETQLEVAFGDVTGDGIDDLAVIGNAANFGNPGIAVVRPGGPDAFVRGVNAFDERLAVSRAVTIGVPGANEERLVGVVVDDLVVVGAEGPSGRPAALGTVELQSGSLADVVVRPTIDRSAPPGRVLARWQLGSDKRARSVTVDADGSVDLGALLDLPPLAIEASDGDVDGDGDLDRVILLGLIGVVDLWLDIDGTPVIADSVMLPVVGSSLVVRDIDDDGRTDAIVASSGGSLFLLRGEPSGGLADAVELVDVGGPVGWIDVVDWNGDGGLEIVVQVGDRLELVRRSSASWTSAPIRMPDGTPLLVYAARLGDVDGDGHLDVVGSDAPAGGTMMVARGDGPPSAPRATPVALAMIPVEQAAGLVDFDGDGRAEIVATGPNDMADIVVRTGTCPTACLGDVDADGEVDFDDLLAMLAPETDWIESPAVIWDLNGDFDRDFSDVVVLLSNWGPCTP